MSAASRPGSKDFGIRHGARGQVLGYPIFLNFSNLKQVNGEQSRRAMARLAEEGISDTAVRPLSRAFLLIRTSSAEK